MKKNQNIILAYSVFLAAATSELSETLPIFRTTHENTKQDLISLIKRGKKDGSIRTSLNEDHGAILLGSHLLGISMHSIVDPDYQLQDTLDALREFLSFHSEHARSPHPRRHSCRDHHVYLNDLNLPQSGCVYANHVPPIPHLISSVERGHTL